MTFTSRRVCGQLVGYRPTGHAIPDIEIHTDGPPNTNAEDHPQRLSSLAKAICDRLRSMVLQGSSVKVVLWQKKLLRRRIIAGIYTADSTRQRVRSPRWGVAMDHVARVTDEKNNLGPAAWHLIPRNELGLLASQHCIESAQGIHVFKVESDQQ